MAVGCRFLHESDGEPTVKEVLEELGLNQTYICGFTAKESKRCDSLEAACDCLALRRTKAVAIASEFNERQPAAAL